MSYINHRNQDATVYVGNLAEECSEALLWELFVQVGRVVRVYMPKDKVLQKHQQYAFVEFRTEQEAEYAQLVLNMVKLHGKPLRVSSAGTSSDPSSGRKAIDVGANLFIGNLSPEVDDKILHDTFSAFGRLTGNAHVATDDGTGRSLSYGFVSYSTFEASDLAIQSMDGQFLCGRMITVQYAFKKDASKKGERERHGSAAERLLAAANPDAGSNFTPHTNFSSGPNAVPLGGPQSFPGPQTLMAPPPPPPPPQAMMMMGGGMMMMPPPNISSMMRLGGVAPPPPHPNFISSGSVPPPPPMLMGQPRQIGFQPPPPLPPPPPGAFQNMQHVPPPPLGMPRRGPPAQGMPPPLM